MADYLFVMSDLEVGDSIIDFSTIKDVLFENKEWIFPEPAYFLKKVKENDRVILYVSGLHKRYFIGSFTITSPSQPIIERKAPFYKYFKHFCKIDDIKIFEKKVHMIDVKDSMEFIKNKQHYGQSLRRNAALLTENDYNFILNKINEI